MNKAVKIVLIVLLILSILGAIGIGFVVKMINKEKEAIDVSKFTTIMERRGYYLTDVYSQYEEYGYIKNAYVASSKDYTFQIEFYELSDEAYAVSFYNNNKDIFESMKANVTSGTNTSGKNYAKYTLTSAGKYMVVSRIDNTVVYVNVEENYKNNVTDILKELGY